MKILFVSTTPLEYSSSANMRNLAMIKGLIELENDVYLLAPKGDINSKYYNKLFDNIKFKKKYYIELGTIYNSIVTNKGKNDKISKLKNNLKLKIHKLITTYSVYDPRKKIAKDFKISDIDETFDIIISSSDPKSSHLLGEKVFNDLKAYNTKWIQYWGDPFLHDINRQSKIPSNIIKKEEQRLLKLANKVIYVSPFTLETQKQTYKELRSKMEFIPVPYLEPKYYSETDNKKFTIGYFGDYYSKDRNIRPLYNAINKMTDHNILKIYGNTDIKLENTQSVFIYERSNYETIQKEEANCDLLVCILNKEGTQIPGKVYHYSATNKPIILVVDGNKKEEMKSYFNKFNRFIICENDEKSIIESINYAKTNKLRYKPLEAFNYKIVAEKFINTIKD